jgi:hypothetical protein
MATSAFCKAWSRIYNDAFGGFVKYYGYSAVLE